MKPAKRVTYAIGEDLSASNLWRKMDFLSGKLVRIIAPKQWESFSYRKQFLLDMRGEEKKPIVMIWGYPAEEDSHLHHRIKNYIFSSETEYDFHLVIASHAFPFLSPSEIVRMNIIHV